MLTDKPRRGHGGVCGSLGSLGGLYQLGDMLSICSCHVTSCRRSPVTGLPTACRHPLLAVLLARPIAPKWLPKRVSKAAPRPFSRLQLCRRLHAIPPGGRPFWTAPAPDAAADSGAAAASYVAATRRGHCICHQRAGSAATAPRRAAAVSRSLCNRRRRRRSRRQSCARGRCLPVGLLTGRLSDGDWRRDTSGLSVGAPATVSRTPPEPPRPPHSLRCARAHLHSKRGRPRRQLPGFARQLIRCL